MEIGENLGRDRKQKISGYGLNGKDIQQTRIYHCNPSGTYQKVETKVRHEFISEYSQREELR